MRAKQRVLRAFRADAVRASCFRQACAGRARVLLLAITSPVSAFELRIERTHARARIARTVA